MLTNLNTPVETVELPGDAIDDLPAFEPDVLEKYQGVKYTKFYTLSVARAYAQATGESVIHYNGCFWVCWKQAALLTEEYDKYPIEHYS